MPTREERVAKAIFDAASAGGVEDAFGGVPWEEVPEHHRDHYRVMARAALSAAEDVVT